MEGRTTRMSGKVKVKEGTPSDEELEEMAVEIGDRWQSLGRRLEFSDAELTAFHKENEKYSEKVYKMLLTWKRRNGPDALYRYLYEALCHRLVNQKHLAVKLCCNAVVIPAYVLARGDKAQRAYYRALQENGKTYDKRVKVAVIGQDRVGKTSLVRSLYDEPFNEKEESTEGVQMRKPLKNVDANAWKNGDVLQSTTAYDHKCAEIMSKDLLAMAAKQQIDEELDEEEEYETAEEIPEELACLTEQNLKGNSPDEGIWPVIWDFAGQAVYHAIHPIFLSPQAVYVLVFDITKNLSDTAQCHVMLHGKKELVPSPDREDTNLDQLMRWMDMVHSLKHSIDRKRARESLPPVILVGTHADGVDGDPWTEMDTLLDTFCDNNEVYDKHIIPDKFVIDNTRSGLGQEDPQIVELRQKILNVASMMPHTGEEIPLQWLRIEKEIYDSAKQGLKYVEKQEFAKKFYNSENVDDLDEVLHFLHARGTIIYHDCDSSSDCLVVLDPQWLIDVLCQIITPAAPRRKEPSFIRKQRSDLAMKGILAEELRRYACKNLKLDHIQGALLSIMVKFNLICNWRNQNGKIDYLVPCMLTEQPPSNEGSGTTSKESASVYLTFSTNYVPSGLFSRLVVLIGRWISSRSPCKQPDLFAKTACFFIGEYHCLCLVCYKSVIKLHVQDSRRDSSDPLEGEPGLCLQILRCLIESLEKLRKDCHWLQSMSWELCAPCDLCPGKVNPRTENCFWHKKQRCCHKDCAHYIPLNSSPFCCPDARGPKYHLCKEKFKPWLKALEIIECEQNPAGPFVTPTDLSKVRSDLHPESKLVYKMTANPRGLVLIINNRTFDPEARLDERFGSEKDVESVQQLFEGLQFEVHTETDLTRSRILAVLDDFAQKDHSGFDCFVVWLMSHGNDNVIYGTDGETVLIETARDFFSNASCESLKGKPKLFFIQACRGGREDKGVVTDGPPSSLDESPPVPVPSSRRDETRIIPDQADFMTAHAAVSGYVSYRSEQGYGSSYVRCLVEVFRERAGYEHLMELLTEVTNRVSAIVHFDAQSSNQKLLQCPQQEPTLRKPLFFWPGQ